jgi:hypothetical protein
MHRSPLRFFLLVFALSIPIWLVEPGDWPITAAVAVPLVAALILIYREERAGRVQRLSRRVFDCGKIRKKLFVSTRARVLADRLRVAPMP